VIVKASKREAVGASLLGSSSSSLKRERTWHQQKEKELRI
jgi:hypothetical protein